MSRFSFINTELGPYTNLSINGVDMQLNWENTMLFTHKHNDYFDHVFVELPELEEDEEAHRAVGAFIWRQVMPDWQDLANGLITHDYPHLHKPWPSSGDVEQYKVSGLKVPTLKEIVAIEEVEDTDEVMRALTHIDEEWDWFDRDRGYYDGTTEG